MKVLFVESVLTGHRAVYHSALINGVGNESSVLIMPEKENKIKCKQVVDKDINLRPKNLKDYKNWIDYICKIANQEQTDVIHFLDGDILYKFFGFYMSSLRDYKVIITFHHIADDLAHSISVNRIVRKNRIGIVHTDTLNNRFKNNRNIRLIDYPYFPTGSISNRDDARRYFQISDEKTVYLSLGGTRYEKGLDILVEAFQKVDRKDAVLLIAGKEEYFKREDIERLNINHKDIIYHLGYLSSEEWNLALAASDVVVLPYRKSFSGASGPLVEAVWFKKYIIGKDDSSVGEMIRTHKLGEVFEAENIESLARTLNSVATDFDKNNLKYRTFRERISLELFRSKYISLYKE